MYVREGISLALEAIFANKMRSALTLLGVVIGVASVVGMVSIGSGAERSVTAEVNSLGSNMIFVQPDFQDEEHEMSLLKPRDLRAIQAGARNLTSPTAFSNGAVEIRMANKRMQVTMGGTGAGFLTVQNLAVKEGRFYTEQEVKLGAKVCVLGSQVREELVGKGAILDRGIRLNGVRFLVIGVMPKKAERTMVQDGLTGDNMIYLPLTSFQRLTGSTDVPVLIGLPSQPRNLKEAVGEIKAIIARLYGLNNGFMVSSTQDILVMINKFTNIFTIVLGCLGGISLLVGGIGVMNIMLVAVTERTREIGTRRAVGAKRRDIILQFLTESITLSTCGGLLGILIGSLLAWLVGALTPVSTAVTGWAVLLAFGCVGAIGVLFGLYPAWRAAYLDPIEALRYE